MKKARIHNSSAVAEEDLLPEYDLDYSKSKPNRFAARMSRNSIAVVLDPDVASVFDSSEAVNTLLRSVIAAMPRSPRRRTPKRKKV